MKKVNTIIVMLIFSQVCLGYEIICPKIPYTAVSMEIVSKVIFNKKTSLYTYQYTFKNNANSQLPIDIVRMQTYQHVQSVKALRHWSLEYQDFANSISWSANVGFDDSVIQPGTSLSGFEFESPNPPGQIKYSIAGWKSVNNRNNFPRIIYAEGEKENYAHDEIKPKCPGENFEGRIPEVIGITTGPILPGTIEVKLRAKRPTDKKWQGRIDEEDPKLEISPLDTGKIQLMLFDDKEVDVSKIDLKSITFGPGEAAPIKTEFTQYIDDEKDSEIVEHLKKHSKSHLFMEFSLAALKVECDIDRALFFNAKLGDKKLTGAVKIKHAICSDVHKIKTEKGKK